MTIRNLEKAFWPQSVAIVGASTRPGSVGRIIVDNIKAAGFSGQIWPVNPKYQRIGDLECFAEAENLSAASDLAVIATPPQAVPGIVEALGRRGTRAAVVITAGFGQGPGSLRQRLLDAVRLQKIPGRIIGVLAAKGQGGFGADQDDIVLVPIRMLQRRITGNTGISSIQVSVRDGISTAKVKSNIEYLLRERRRISDGEEDDFNVLDMTELTNTLTATTTVLTGLLGAVAAVSLLVGGIGIMNIMLVSVTERTREIGIRLAIGALKRQVLMQFLIEAVVLSLFGGILGIALGLGLAAVAASYLSAPFVLSPSIIVGAFLFSAAVGVIFGFFPARRAVNFDPIEALRHE